MCTHKSCIGRHALSLSPILLFVLPHILQQTLLLANPVPVANLLPPLLTPQRMKKLPAQFIVFWTVVTMWYNLSQLRKTKFSGGLFLIKKNNSGVIFPPLLPALIKHLELR